MINWMLTLNVVLRRKELTDTNSVRRGEKIGPLAKYLFHDSLSLYSVSSCSQRSVQRNSIQSFVKVGVVLTKQPAFC